MAQAKCTDAEFIAIWKELQSAKKVSDATGIQERAVNLRRRNVEKRHGIVLPVYDPNRPRYNTHISENKAVAQYRIQNGTILVGSDAHVWPGPLTTMQRAFLKFAKDLRPAAIVANGDFFDGAKVSRHASIGWEHRPSVKQELEAVQDYMGELAKHAPKLFWPLGNHDARYESKIANTMPELEGIKGVHLKDHFPQWFPCWRLDVNDDVIIRHRELGGEHADFRNVQTSGKTIVTGHDHRANVTAYRNYTGVHWGVRCGYMADAPTDPQFVNYLEAREPNWQPAFVVLTFKEGQLLWPELCVKHDDSHVQFRGQVISV